MGSAPWLGCRMTGLLLALVALVAVVRAEDRPTDEAHLGVYLESLCPDSRRFVLDQLVPTYKQIGSLFKVNIVPFGHARVLGNNKMVCQHGTRECEGNRLMACVLARAKDNKQSINTIGCLFEAQESPKDCVTKNMPEVSFDDIDKCKTSDESYQMMMKNEQSTGRVGYVPKLTYNDAYSQDIQGEAEFGLKEFICKNYNGTKPEACNVAEAT